MTTGKVTLSIDLELAWGVWDTVTAQELQLAETAERPICAALVELFDRYEVPASWLVVAALLDEASAKPRPGAKACWYAPDVIERIVRAKVRHEIGSHGGRHIYFDQISAEEARDDLGFAKSVHRANGLGFESFVFPRSGVGHLDIVAKSGLRVVRSRDVGLLRTAHTGGRLAARAANLVDQFLPVPPRPSWPEALGPLIDIPGCMQVLGRNGLRRCVLPQVTRAKLAIGLERARAARFISGSTLPTSTIAATSSWRRSPGSSRAPPRKLAAGASNFAPWAATRRRPTPARSRPGPRCERAIGLTAC
jgi:hypothetical protein